MRVKDLGIRSPPASIRDLLSRVVRGQGPTTKVERRPLPYWQEQGWTRQGDIYTGSYHTRYSAFQGWIEQQRSGLINFCIYNPPQVLRDHSHWTCFQHRGSDWYLVHMAKQPKDVGSGIITIEKLITEAYTQ